MLTIEALVGCETSGVVRDALRARGVAAYSCDLLPAQDGSLFHLQDDIRAVLARPGLRLLIAHPPCTYLCNSGVGRLHHTPPHPSPGVPYGDARWQAMQDGAALVAALWDSDALYIALENPVMHGYAHAAIQALCRRRWPRATQIIQPYYFGDDASKATGLWLRGVERLVIPPATQWAAPRIVNGQRRWSNQTDSGQNKELPSQDRWQRRSNTYPGVAAAMAAHWADSDGAFRLTLLFFLLPCISLLVLDVVW